MAMEDSTAIRILIAHERTMQAATSVAAKRKSEKIFNRFLKAYILSLENDGHVVLSNSATRRTFTNSFREGTRFFFFRKSTVL